MVGYWNDFISLLCLFIATLERSWRRQSVQLNLGILLFCIMGICVEWNGVEWEWKSRLIFFVMEQHMDDLLRISYTVYMG